MLLLPVTKREGGGQIGGHGIPLQPLLYSQEPLSPAQTDGRHTNGSIQATAFSPFLRSPAAAQAELNNSVLWQS